MAKSIAIIGGGVSGLSAGIYGQLAGFETTIYEKNTVLGGSLSGWYRDGYAIDNCLHWLTGTNAGTPQYKIWEDTGVINEETVIVKRPYFFAAETDGIRVTLWRDPEQTRKEMLEISPEDSMEINLFVDCVEVANDLIMNGMGLENLQRIANENELVLSNFDFARKSVLYMGLNNIKWAERFKHPALKNLILDFSAKEYESYWLIVAYGFYVAGNADLIEGGSIKMADSLVKRYLELGGRIETNMAAKQIVIRKRRLPKIEGMAKIKTKHGDWVLFENGSEVIADYIICACDVNYAYKYLIKRKYKNKMVKEVSKRRKDYPLYSAYQAAFAVDGLFDEVKDSLSFPCAPIEIAHSRYERVSIKNYRIYGDYIAPEGKTVIQCMFIQYEKDFKFWRKLYKQDKEHYKQVKENAAQAVLTAIEKYFPQYEGKIKVLDSWTPYTYNRRNNDTDGAFMRYITTAIGPKAHLSQEVRGVDNVFLAGHWLKYPGGVPMAASTGKTAVRLIYDREVKPTFDDYINQNIEKSSEKSPFTTLCYMEKDDSYLMLHRTKKENDANKDKYIGVGGHFEAGESAADCLRREVLEETGLTLTDYQPRGIVTFNSDEWGTEYMFLYTATGFEGTMKECTEGELEWIPKKDIYSLPLWEGDKIFFDLLIKDQPYFDLKLTYKGEKLVEAVLDGKRIKE